MKRWFTLWLCLLFVAASLAPAGAREKGRSLPLEASSPKFFPMILSHGEGEYLGLPINSWAP